MKTTHTILFGLVAASAWLIAGSVTIPHTFQANTTAKAAEVNANFSAVKTAVDGNANDIATNEADIATNKTDIAAAVTNIRVGAGLSISRVDGNVTIKKRSGYVAVHGSAFNTSSEYGNYCALVRNWVAAGTSTNGIYFHPSSNGTNCKAFAEVEIPRGAKIKSMTCRVKHNVSDTLDIKLYKQNREYHFTPFPPHFGEIRKNSYITASLTAADQSSLTQEASGTYTQGGPILLNSSYASYYIEWDPHNNYTDNEALFDCKVDYEY